MTEAPTVTPLEEATASDAPDISRMAGAHANRPPVGEKLRAYTKTKLALAAQLRALGEIVKQSGSERRLKQCEELMVKLAEDRFTLAVLGQFERGKSSLLNAIVGRAVLPVGALPLTSAVTVLKFGPNERLLIKPRRLDFTFPEPVERLADYVTEKGNPGNRKQIERATLELPVSFLRRGLEFVDTPGVGSAIEANTATTYSFLPACDAVLFVTSVETPFTKVELEFLKEIRQHVRKIFFVVNKTDLLAEGERAEVLEFVTQTIRARMGTGAVRVFPVSARLGLEAQRVGDVAGYAQSGLTELEEALARFLSEEKAAVFLAAMVDRALRLLEQEAVEAELHSQARAITDAELSKKLAVLQARWREHETARRKLFDELRHHVAAQTSTAVTPELQAFLHAERAKLSRDMGRVLTHVGWKTGRSSTRRMAGHALNRLRRNLCRWAAAHAERLSFGTDARAQGCWEQMRANLGEIPPRLATAAFVAQVSKPAVSPIFNRQTGARAIRVEKPERPAGLEPRDTADLEVRATRKATAADRLPPWRLDVVFEPPVLPHLEWRPSINGALARLPVRFARAAFKRRMELEFDRWMKAFDGLALAWIARKVREALDRLSETVRTQAQEIEARLLAALTGKRPPSAAENDAALACIRGKLRAIREEIAGTPLPAEVGEVGLNGERNRLGCCSARPRAEHRPPGTHDALAAVERSERTAGAPSAAPEAGALPISTASFQTRGCPVCDHLYRVAFQFFAQWQYALCTEEKAQTDFAAELGFCPLHAWQLAAVSSPVGASVGWAKLMERLSQIMSQATNSSLAPQYVSELVRRPVNCRVCQLLGEAEKNYVRQFAEALNEPQVRNAYARSQGLCLRHLGLLLSASANGDATQFLMSHAGRRFEEIAEDMQSYALKTDARRRSLRHQDEDDAYLRALTHIVGARSVCCPWDNDVEI